MNIDKAIIKKEKLENDVLFLLKTFEKETGTSVIDVGIMNMNMVSGKKFVFSVDIVISI